MPPEEIEEFDYEIRIDCYMMVKVRAKNKDQAIEMAVNSDFEKSDVKGFEYSVESTDNYNE